MYSWDPKKNDHNKEKHGISFEEAVKHIFEDQNLLVFDVAYNKNEPRHAIIGKYKKKYYTGIFTIRSNNIRIISVRRARHDEEKQAKDQRL